MIHGDAEVKRMRLVELNPAPYNPRKISEYASDGLGMSLEKFGVLSLIIWNKRSGNIVGGHQRYEKLIEMGETETDVVVVDLDNDDEIALNIMLNNPNARGDYTSDVKLILEKVEVQIGSVFNDLRLNDLHKTIKEASSGGGSGEHSDNDDNDEEDDDDDDADTIVITCPACQSMWRMSDDEVLVKNDCE
jgi:hypothetical protein